MKFVYLICAMLVCCSILWINSCEGRNNRVKRFLKIRNNTKFFVRYNFKANIISWNQIFAQALGFRINWDILPENSKLYHALYKRDLYRNAEEVLNRNGVNGSSCIKRAICETNALPEKYSIYNDVLKIIFTQTSSATERWHRLEDADCSTAASACPFSLLEVSPYTDI